MNLANILPNRKSNRVQYLKQLNKKYSQQCEPRMIHCVSLKRLKSVKDKLSLVKFYDMVQISESNKQPSQIYTPEEVAKHNTPSDCWAIFRGEVYDLTKFAAQHPGGEKYVHQYAGKDITNAMTDEEGPHDHSTYAYQMLKQFHIGSIPICLKSGSSSGSTTDSNDERQSELKDLLRKVEFTEDTTPFLDLSKPLMLQMFNCTLDKATYMKKVHIPQHLDHPAIIFGHPFLESLTKTFWWIIPLYWLPICSYLVYHSYLISGLNATILLFMVGLVNFSFLEYALHRFLFHIEYFLPDNRVGLTIHFVLHGIHHFVPMDGLRLVMPPTLSTTLATLLWYPYKLVWGSDLVYGVFAGILFGYVCYDLTHYYLHHGKALNNYLQSIKTHHLDHHYKNYEVGFGISSKLWDLILNTDFPKKALKNKTA